MRDTHGKSMAMEDQADNRIKLTAKLAEPIYLAPPATEPTTQEAITLPTTMMAPPAPVATTQPATTRGS